MNLLKLRFAGVTRFDRIVDIDFEQAPAGLLAVAGPNGAGKTTILECVLLAIYGVLPSREGSAYDYLSEPAEGDIEGRKPAPFVDLTAEHGGSVWNFYRRFSVKARSQTCQVWVDGVAMVEDDKASDAARLVVDRWPPLSQVLASAFAAQGGGGSFLSLKTADRKALIVRMLGLDRIQELHAIAAEQARELSAIREQADQAVVRARAEADRLEDARERLRVARRQQEAAEAVCSDADADAAVDRGALQDAREAADEAHRHLLDQQKTTAAAEQALRDAERAVTDADRALKDAEQAAAEVDELRALAAQVPELRAAYEAAAQREREHNDAVTRARSVVRDAQADVDAAARERDVAAAEVERLQAVVGDLDQRQRAAADYESACIDFDSAHAWATRTEAELAKARPLAEQERALRRSIDRDARASGLVNDVPCGGDVVGDVDCSGCPLLSDAVAARGRLDEQRARLAEIEGSEARVAELQRDLDTASRRRRDAGSRRGALIGAPERLAAALAANERLVAMQAKRDASVGRCEAAVAELERAQDRVLDLVEPPPAPPDRTALDAAEQAAAALADVATQAARLDDMRERAQAARDAIDTARDAVDEERTTLEVVKVEADMLAARAKSAERPAVKSAEAARVAARRLAEASTANARAAGAVEALEGAAGKLDDARERLRRADRDAEDADLLAASLGRDGVQAMELDAVGPAVSSIATEILRVVYGPRFVVQLVTQVLKKGAAGKRGETREVFDVRVIDDLRGTDGPAGRLSGGEQVVVSEAIKLALSVFAAQSGAAPIRTLVRDESDGALDDERAQHYPAMLRRAMDLGGFTRVLLVSHRPSNVAACDAVLRVADGDARLEIA